MSVKPSSLLERLRAHAEDRPASTVIMAPERRPLTYAALLDQVEDVGALLRKHGLGLQDRVAVVVDNGPEMASAIVAVACNAISVPLNPAFTLAEWYRLFEDLGIDALISDRDVGAKANIVAKALNLPIFDLQPGCDEPAGRLFLRTEAATAPVAVKKQVPDATAIAFLLPTSGTTSRPKIVPLTHANLWHSANNTGRSLALTANDRLLNMLPFYHAHGLISGLMASLAAGASVVCTNGFSARDFFAWLNAFEPSWYTAVPTIHQAVLALAAEQKEAARESSLRFIRSASASLPKPVLEGLERHFHVPVIETYGMTEAASQIASNPLPPKPRKAGSVGPAAGPAIAIWNNDGEVQATGEIGEIVLSGPNVTGNYLDNDAANQEAFADGWFRTGDQGYLDQDGYLFITGRLKEMINRGGQTIAPREIEEVLLAYADVDQAVAFALPHPTLGEEVGAAVVPTRGAAIDPDELKRLVAASLATHKWPRWILILDDLPKGPTGKLQRIGFAEKLGLTGTEVRAAETQIERQSELTQTEQQVLEIWQDVLNVERIDRGDDFFLLGGDSLSATRILSRIKTTFQVTVPVSDFFERSTIAALAECIEAADVDQTSRSESIDDTQSAPLSFQQESLYFLDRLTPGRSSHHVVDLIELEGQIDIEALEKTLAAMIRRHDVLRTVFREDGGAPSQTVLETMPTPFVVKTMVSDESRETSIADEVRANFQRPFDLEHGPLFRLRLLVVNDDGNVLALTIHHLITDGWSQGLFWADFEKIYNALTNGHALPSAGDGGSYISFVRRQRAWVESPAAGVQRRYWQRQLKGLTRLPLPTDRRGPLQACGEGARYPIEFSRYQVQWLRALGRRHRSTLFMTLLAAFQTLLFRYTNHPDVTVGSVIANRNSVEAETLLGMLANTILLRTDFSDDPTFETLLQRVRSTTLDAYRHQDLPFDDMLAGLSVPRQADAGSTVTVMFLLQSPPPKAPVLGDADGSFIHVDPGRSRFDLTLELIDQEDGHLGGWFEYSTTLFEAATIRRMAGHLLHLIDAALAKPTKKISLLPLLSYADHRELQNAAEGPRAKEPDARSVIALFEDQVGHSADATAVMDGDARLSFSKLNRRANQLAHHLVDEGVTAGDFVGLMVGRSVDMVVALLGILKTGAAFVPLDPDYPRDRLAFIIEDGGIKVAVSEHAHIGSDLLDDLKLVLMDQDGPAFERRSGDNLPAIPSPEDVAYVLYTSGSTGRPKGVLGTHRGLLHILSWVWRHLPFEPGEVCCHKTSISFGDSLQELFAPLLRGHPVVIIDKDTLIDPERFVACLAEHGMQRLVLVPSLLRTLLRENPDLSGRLPALKLWVSSGEALDGPLARQFYDLLPDRRLINIYGASEMADIVTWHEVRDDDGVDGNPPIGRPIDNVSTYVLDEAQQLVPRGVAGELCVASPGLAKGYHRRPDLVGRVFITNPFGQAGQDRLYRTGDRVLLRADGALDYLGRLDQQVQIRGCRVELGEVERTLKEHPSIDQAAVLALADEHDDRHLVAFVQPCAGDNLSAESLHGFAQKKLPSYMLPSRYAIIDTLPLTPSGKIDRQSLEAREERAGQADSLSIPARSPIEEILVGIWSDVLNTEGLGVTDHFFEQGGHSLLAGQVLARVRVAFCIELPLRSIFDYPTIADFAPLIEASQKGDPSHQAQLMVLPAAEETAKPSRAQMHVLGVERSLPGLPIFNLAYGFRLRGHLDVGAFRKALHHVVKRHEALRMHFSDVDDQVTMMVDDLPQATLEVDGITGGVEQAALIAKEETWTPFAVNKGPLLRVRLLRLEADDHICLITIHHIITDGWSMGILVREISKSYDAFRLGRSPHLSPDPPPAFSSIAAWQRLWCESELAAQQRAYWRAKLEPEAHARKAACTAAGTALSLSIAHHPIALPEELRQRLISFARRQGGTLFMTLLAALVPVLAPVLGRSTLVIGTIFANRMRTETEHVFGPLETIALLPLAADPDLSLSDRMPGVRDTVLEAAANQDLPFDDLVDAWPREKNGPLMGLIDAMFVFQDAMRDTLDLADLEVVPFGDVHRVGQPVLPISNARLTIILRDTPEGIVGNCVYKSDKLQEHQIQELLDNYLRSLDQVS